MDSRSNVIAMMGLGALIVALGSSIVAGEAFHAERPEKMGYVVEGVEAEAGAAAATAEPPIAMMMAGADVTKGAEVFKKCASCHSINEGGANGIGPNLWASMGQPHAHVAGFAYSDALKAVPGNWDFEAMNKWLKNPRTYAPGTKMSFAGLSKAEDRANLIAYLNAQGSNLPLPAAPVQAAAEEGAAPAENAAAPAEGAAAPAEDSAAKAKP
ncbi:MAG: c-type cytochrome [Sphingomonadaceae bacterium]